MKTREKEREKGGWWLEDVMRLEMEDEGSKLDRNNHPDGELAFLDNEDTNCSPLCRVHFPQICHVVFR